MTAEDIANRLVGAHRSGDSWSARCPAHQDSRASLSVTQGADGKVLLHCHAGCTPGAICHALGIEVKDLFNGAPKVERRILAVYPYQNEGGNVLFEVVRFEPKDFRQRAPDGTWNVKGIRKVLFHLPQLIAAVKEGQPVFICEGEKDCLAVEQAGFAATCNPGGAGKWRPEYGEHLAGAEVVIIADRDKAGRDHAANVAAKLHGTAASVRVTECPDTNGCSVKDASDYFQAGGQAGDLDELARAAPLWAPPGLGDAPRYKPGSVADEYLGQDSEQEVPPPVARPLSALVRHAEGADPNELLMHRYLCRGGGLLLCGPTGIGKSALEVQCSLLWALSRECLGLVPARALRSLIVQAENDDGDLAEIRDGVIRGLALSEPDAEAACGSVLIVTEDTRTGATLCSEVLRPLLAEHRPDLLWLDPALAYLGGEAGSQRDVGGFLRNGLNPLLHEFGCGGIPIHHTAKPKVGKEKPNWQAGDFAYLGLGSVEWPNWARAVLALRSIGSHDVYELHAGKRGQRLRWHERDGSASYVRYLAHATEPGVICWYDVDPEDVNQGGRPKEFDEADLLALLPDAGMTSSEWRDEAARECGVKERRFYQMVKALEKRGATLKSKATKKWLRVQKNA